MSEPLVLALVAADVSDGVVSALRAGFEEESVPLAVERAHGTGEELGRVGREPRHCSASASVSMRAARAPCSPPRRPRRTCRRRSPMCARSRRTPRGSRGAARCGGAP